MRNHFRRHIGSMTRDEGYTLTEMLVVIAVIGLIAAVLTPGLVGQLGRARAKTAQMQLETIAAGVEMFRADTGRYPTAAQGLDALINQPPDLETWTGPYLKSEKVLADPWGNPVQYRFQEGARGFSVVSYGADGRAGGLGLDRDLQAPAQ